MHQFASLLETLVEEDVDSLQEDQDIDEYEPGTNRDRKESQRTDDGYVVYFAVLCLSM